MKRFIFCIMFLVSTITLTGCSSSITETYPEVKNDFTQDDYKELKSLSNNGQLSYEELCYEFIKNNADNEVNRVINDLLSIGELSNLTCKKTENNFTFSYNFEIDGGNTVITFITDIKEYKVKSIQFNSKDLKFTAKDDIIEIIEGDKDSAYKINRVINNDSNIKNKIYAISKKYYYLPIENNEVRVFSSKYDFDKSYKSSIDYWNNQIKENDEKINDLEESLNKTEELY